MNTKKTGLFIFLILLVFVFSLSFTGCSTLRKELTPSYELAAPDISVEEPSRDGSAEQPGSEERKQVKQANLELEVKDIDKNAKKAIEIVKNKDGYVEQENYFKDGYRGEISTSGMDSATLILRVPSDKLENTIDELKKLGEVKNYGSNIEDVTQTYSELEIKLEHLYSEAKRLENLYQQAKDVSEVLQVEKELSRVREEIEVTENQLSRLKTKVNYATIFLNLTQPYEISYPINDIKQLFSAFITYLFLGIEYLLKALAFILPFLVLYYLVKMFKWAVAKISRNK